MHWPSPTELATPAFIVLVIIEMLAARYLHRGEYETRDTATSLMMGFGSTIFGALFAFVFIAFAGFVWKFRLTTIGWSWAALVLCFVLDDLAYYWWHRASHRVRWLWASHVTHHSSERLNLSTAFRQSLTYPISGMWVFWLPLAWIGFAPANIVMVVAINLAFQFFVHTQAIGRLGPFEYVFNTPSHHRVHHARNAQYIDRNYGGVLIVWDRIFGSFVEEGEKCVYGTRAPLNSWDPLWANAEVYWSLAKDSWHARSWADKIRVWIKPPGWRPADVAERFPNPAFDIAKAGRFEPARTKGLVWFATLQFALLLVGVVAFLWNAEGMPLADAAVWVLVQSLAVWAIGAAMQGRITMLEGILIEVAALATATAATGMTDVFRVLKPLAMAIAIVFVMQRGRVQWALVSALAFSMIGDVLLPERFMPGLVSFLIAHLCYIALFKRDAPWFASRRALACTLGAAALMYAVLFPHLAPVLKVAVACYALVIACMAAQAIGRATVVRDANAIAVTVGAVVFMLSDSILAIDKFAIKLPMVQFMILATYFAAQVLIVHNARSGSGDSLPRQSSAKALDAGSSPA